MEGQIPQTHSLPSDLIPEHPTISQTAKLSVDVPCTAYPGMAKRKVKDGQWVLRGKEEWIKKSYIAHAFKI